MSQNLFVGIPLSESVKTRLEAFQQNHAAMESIRWIPPENFHITACFLGKDKDLKEIQQRFLSLAHQFSVFTLPFHSFCLMPSRRPSMVWARFEATKLYRKLHEQLHQALLNQSPTREPVPHITLARFKRKMTDSQFQLDERLSEPIRARHLTLWQTVPVRGGVRYRPIETVALQESSSR